MNLAWLFKAIKRKQVGEKKKHWLFSIRCTISHLDNQATIYDLYKPTRKFVRKMYFDFNMDMCRIWLEWKGQIALEKNGQEEKNGQAHISVSSCLQKPSLREELKRLESLDQGL